MKFRLDEQTVRKIENWLNGQAQRVLISGLEHHWRPVTCSLPQGSVLNPMLFNFLICIMGYKVPHYDYNLYNDLYNGVAGTLSKLANDTKLGGVSEMPEACAAIQKDLHRLEKWAERTS